ncbi:MAG: PEP-CTERM sorting domain-containing protein [Candidatus Rokubacteria bacterium]|nr:PEP-CTERM sorting domain-containing protein [Candidatus Rokubacteria bacterium]
MAILVGFVAAPLVAQAAPITDLGVVYDATYALVGTGVGNETYQVTVTAETSGSTLPGDFLTSLAIKIAAPPNIISFSLVSGPAGGTLLAGGVNAFGCNPGSDGFVCDAFTPISMPGGLVTLILNETIATGTLFTGDLAASIKAEYCDVGTGIGTTGLGCPSGQNGGITSEPITLTPVPEPITMFLGGTGLLLLGYAARKRLFGGQRATAI